jgi:uncharacterized membrane protein YdjX (TVP38/TMEM64 family)
MSDIIRKLTRDTERDSLALQRQMNRTMRAVREQSFAPIGGYRPSPVSPVSSVNIPAGVTVSVIAPRFP